MYLKQLYTNIIQKQDSWNYYGLGIADLDISNSESCRNFVKEYIQLSEKSEHTLYGEIDELFEKDPQRITHIVSTFFLGMALLNNKRFGIEQSIISEIEKLKVFDSEDIIKSELPYIWFLATLFHDLGYNAEKSEMGKELPNYTPESNIVSVPDFYTKVYKKYYEYRKNKEHGIYGGIRFIVDMLEIRKREEHNPKSKRYWGKELELLYSHIGWIIIAHNIWFKRRDELYNGDYAEMQELVLEEDKNYRIKFDEYPLFFFFCLVDVLEPTKNTTLFSKVNITLENRKIIISTNDKSYSKAIMGLNKWLTPVEKDGEKLIIDFNCKEIDTYK
jgi:hypothetical protein